MLLARRLTALCFALALLCAAPRAAAQEWFDAYERGVRALREGRGVQAVLLLERAARLRPEPGSNVITYGTNRIERYHPYLRLAEAFLLVGDLPSAREALRSSELRGKEPAPERAALAQKLEDRERQARVAQATPAPPATATPVAARASPSPAVAAPSLAAAAVQASPDGVAAGPAPPTPASPPARPTRSPAATPLAASTSGASGVAAPRLARASPTARPTAAPAVPSVAASAVPSAGPSPAPSAAAEAAGPARGTLILFSSPPGAAAYLDDEFLGSTDPGSGRLVRSGVASGAHRLRLALAGRQDAQQDVTIVADTPTSVRVELPQAERRLPPATFAGLLAAAVALAGLGLYLRKSRARPAGAADATLTRVAARPERTPSPPESRTPGRQPATVGGPRTPTRVQAGGRPDEAPTTATPLPVRPSGETFGPYLLAEPLGRGGMATVHRALRNAEEVALKRPLKGFTEDPEFLERFLREAEIGRTLHHPNIIRIFERGEVEGTPYFTMELVRGETLQARLRRDGAFEPRTAALLVSQVAEALDYAHLKGVIHRDLKPSNIMLLADGGVKVMDYGIARARRFDGLTVTGSFLGTPDYVAPETAEGRGTDARSDLYSLGVVFYELLTGQKPFVGNTPFETLRKHCSEEPTPPSAIAHGCPRAVEAIVLKLLRKDADQRYPSAEELLIELREYINRAG
ncbi:MAG: protein kinase [Vicinamibacteria bacterium]